MTGDLALSPAPRRFPLRRIVIGLIVVAALVAAACGVAFAYWTSSGTGTASVTTGTLNAPQAVTAASTPGDGTVSVSWTAPAGVDSPSYYVTRTDSANSTTSACGTSATHTTAGTGCSDTAVPVGTYTYRVTVAYRSWTATSLPSASVSVARAGQTVTLTSTPTNPTYGGSYTVTASGGASGNPVTFSTATPAICGVTGSTVSFLHAGTCTITADQAGSTYYDPAPQALQSFTVAQAPQLISFTSAAPADAVVAGASYVPVASGGASNNPVAFTVDATTSSNCTLIGGSVTYQHAGTCTIDANQLGTADYLAANQVQQSIAVNQGSQALTFTSTPPSPARVGGSYVVSATSSAGLAVSVTLDPASVGCTLSGSTVSFTGAGTCVVDANQAGNDDYRAAAPIQQSFPISKNDQTITYTSTAPTTATFGDSPYGASATATSGLGVVFTSATSVVCTSSGTNGATITLVGAGTCTVNADQSGNASYNAAPQVQQTFTVAKAGQSIAFTSTAPAAATVGGAPYTVTATGGASGQPVTFSSMTTQVCTVAGATVSFVGAGTCTVNADQAGTANYNPAPTRSQSFTVGKGTQTITFTSTAPANATAGGATYTVTANGGASGQPVTFASATPATCTVAGATVTFAAAGTCTINANQAGDSNYTAAAQQQQTFGVAPAPATKFAVTAGSTQTAGASFSLTVTAQTAANATATSYTGNHAITLTSTATSSPSGTLPTLPSGTVTFTNGVATITGVTLVRAETVTVTASDSSITGTSASITVAAGTAARLAWTSVTPSTGVLSSPCLFTCTDTGLGNNGTFTAKVSVTDAQGNTVTNLGAGHTVTISTPTAGAGSGGAFSPTSASSVTLTISATNVADSTATFTFKTQPGNWSSDTFTAVTSSGATYTSATASVTKQ